MKARSGARLAAVRRGARLTFTWNGQPVDAFAGETVAAALLAHGVVTLRRTARGDPRGVFCGMGSCFECRVTVDGRGAVRACLTPVAEGMVVSAQTETATLDLGIRLTGGGRD